MSGSYCVSHNPFIFLHHASYLSFRSGFPVKLFAKRNSTAMTQSEPKFAEAIKPAIAIAPMNRMGTPEEIADACLWLCGSGAGFVCGHALVSFFLLIWV